MREQFGYHIFNNLSFYLDKCDPRVNIQNQKGKAKAYQVKQVLKAIERKEVEHGT